MTDKDERVEQEPIVIAAQGAGAFGGRVIIDDVGFTVHVDHGYDEWQIPVNARKTPLLLWHSCSTWTWESTYGGGEGFRNMLLRWGFPLHIIDAPRLGRAGWAGEPYEYEVEVGYDQMIFNGWRIGMWDPPAPPEYFPGVQFPVNDPAALGRACRAAYPEFNVPENVQLESDEVAKLVDELDGVVLVTHSGSGVRGWFTAMKSQGVRGIVSYEPNTFVLPEGEAPPPLERSDGELVSPHSKHDVPLGAEVPVAEFEKLTKFPIQIVFGDNIPTTMDSENVGYRLGLDNRRLGVVRAQIFCDAVNRHGGDAEVLQLPDEGLLGNTHAPMMDLNNVEAARLLLRWLEDHGLGER